MTANRDWKIVPYRPEHRDGVVAVVKSVFDEYGFTWEADGYCRDLYDVETAYLAIGGRFWCAVEGKADRVIGCSGVTIHDGHGELHRMYLLAGERGRGIGRALLETCMEHVRASGVGAMRAWSDVKLPDAHRLYLKAGFVRDGERICDDPDKSREYGFWKEPL
mgnify:CR=1 FL=1